MTTLSEFLEIPEDVEFNIGKDNTIYKIRFGKLLYQNNIHWLESDYKLNELIGLKITILPQPLLTDEEREWLKNVISPFSDEVENICITDCINGEEKVFLQINLKHEEPILFPIFKKGQYYKSLKTKKKYTLADLGLGE